MPAAQTQLMLGHEPPQQVTTAVSFENHPLSAAWKVRAEEARPMTDTKKRVPLTSLIAIKSANLHTRCHRPSF